MKFLLVLVLLISIILTGCYNVRTYTFKKDRVDQSQEGNKGYLIGTPPPAPPTKGVPKRTLIGIDVEIDVLPFEKAKTISEKKAVVEKTPVKNVVAKPAPEKTTVVKPTPEKIAVIEPAPQKGVIAEEEIVVVEKEVAPVAKEEIEETIIEEDVIVEEGEEWIK